MGSKMFVVFIVDNDFDDLYFTTPDKFSLILDKHNITEDRVKHKTVSVESLMQILDGQIEYVHRSH